jgi:hypothetical protein
MSSLLSRHQQDRAILRDDFGLANCLGKPSQPTLDEPRAKLALANRILAHAGVLVAFGYVSVRHPHDPARYLLARSRSPELVEPADILEFTLDAQPVNPYGHAVRGADYCISHERPDVLASFTIMLAACQTGASRLMPPVGVKILEAHCCDRW